MTSYKTLPIPQGTESDGEAVEKTTPLFGEHPEKSQSIQASRHADTRQHRSDQCCQRDGSQSAETTNPHRCRDVWEIEAT